MNAKTTTTETRYTFRLRKLGDVERWVLETSEGKCVYMLPQDEELELGSGEWIRVQVSRELRVDLDDVKVYEPTLAEIRSGEWSPATSWLVIVTRRTGQTLYDGPTTTALGDATPEQVEASNTSELAGENGFILIDSDGDPVEAGTYDAQQPGVRTVYTA